MSNGIIKQAGKTTADIARQAARQVAREPVELLKSGSSQVMQNENTNIQDPINLTSDKLPDITPEEIAKIMGIEVEKAHEIVKISQETTSIETPVGREEDSRLKEFIPDETTLSPFDSASHDLLKEQLVEVLDTLNPRERKVLELRFGIKDGRSRTLEEVGKEFGVTRERIRQIEAKALRKLRHPSRSKRLKDYL